MKTYKEFIETIDEATTRRKSVEVTAAFIPPGWGDTRKVNVKGYYGEPPFAHNQIDVSLKELKKAQAALKIDDMSNMYLFSKPAGMGDYDFIYDSKNKISGAVVHHKGYGR
jgi:hypothetical protein